MPVRVDSIRPGGEPAWPPDLRIELILGTSASKLSCSLKLAAADDGELDPVETLEAERAYEL
ncbi:hypothetical protein [Streptomyces sp. MBT60]|uniref:hypothetical protein n=1 Tax=Streptomyces sp. MBT60 TaxID=2800409 RepID=UPI00190DAEC9|nr:hypothetical protein [Streptomyces sp. MBT60]MBK3543046.1 hypothetical protein [Streptomyces sp. MBT60]